MFIGSDALRVNAQSEKRALASMKISINVRRILFAFLPVWTFLLFSCGNATHSAPTNVAPSLISGNWQMTLQPDAPSTASETEAGFLIQSKNALTGQLLLSAQSECAGLGDVQGTINGSAVTINMAQMGQTVTLTGVIQNDGSSMGGNYSIYGSSCAGGSSAGTWSASPVKPVSGNYVATFTSNAGFQYTFATNVTQAANTG